MPIFEIAKDKLTRIEQKNFPLEKDLQRLIELNLETVFNCRFVSTEFSTGTVHAGRIDSLALSEEDNPVIIEYKKVESSELITQSLFYLHWIEDHKGDFELAVQKAIGSSARVDWSDIRVICIAPNYKRYDLHAVQVMGANIELWRYRLYDNNSLHLEEVFTSVKASGSLRSGTRGVTNSTKGSSDSHSQVTTYTFEEHSENKSTEIKELMQTIREFITGLDSSIEEVPKKLYIAYKTSQNIICMEPQKRAVKLFLKLSPSDVDRSLSNFRDVSSIGHSGTGDVEFTVGSSDDFDNAKKYIELAYSKVGG